MQTEQMLLDSWNAYVTHVLFQEWLEKQPDPKKVFAKTVLDFRKYVFQTFNNHLKEFTEKELYSSVKKVMPNMIPEEKRLIGDFSKSLDKVIKQIESAYVD